ncbi:phage gp6-like head-tail connector protein [Pseudomonas ogarae]|uniref:head-tail connector protein n=1 Tax=Pseudomonas ogarae (strain DSM 112162 / CECT 30235 / F113) TaxID=1114970 RepID=UPI001645B9E2|nr:head-tail connector protein [Pseudomonas zarinae]QXH96111.1 phage gp6-like head-tail connector protein [Pseudomonas zarinae]
MSVIDIELAMKHLRAESEDVEDVQSKLDSAESAAQKFLQRRFYADAAALNAALATVPAARLAARTAYEAAVTTAEAVENWDDRCAALTDAQFVFSEALRNCTAVARGMVINKSIVAACLLTLGHLWANREDAVTGINTSSVTELPHGSRSLLQPDRVSMGV